VNYGGIGGVIGHEISHGFDDSGSRYNADGNLVDWWTADDLKQLGFNRSFSCTIQRIGAIARNFVDGKFTLGENIMI
jgi:predicted metalloendopeptidase